MIGFITVVYFLHDINTASAYVLLTVCHFAHICNIQWWIQEIYSGGGVGGGQ